MAKKREATSSDLSARDAGTPGGMPEVRGDHPSPHVTDLPGISRVPGVQSVDPDRKSKEIPGGLEKVARGSVKNIESLDLDEKLLVLNALRKIRKTPPRISEPSARRLISEFYVTWVDELSSKILGQSISKETPLFTQEEVSALKVLAKTILERQNQTSVTPAKPSMMGANPSPQNAQPMVSRQTLNPGVNTDSYRAAQAQFLSELSKMEREGPQF